MRALPRRSSPMERSSRRTELRREIQHVVVVATGPPQEDARALRSPLHLGGEGVLECPEAHDPRYRVCGDRSVSPDRADSSDPLSVRRPSLVGLDNPVQARGGQGGSDDRSGTFRARIGHAYGDGQHLGVCDHELEGVDEVVEPEQSIVVSLSAHTPSIPPRRRTRPRGRRSIAPLLRAVAGTLHPRRRPGDDPFPGLLATWDSFGYQPERAAQCV